MKPFITPERVPGGKSILRFQWGSLAWDKCLELVESKGVVGYRLPPRQSFKAAWLFRLIFDGGATLQFSSASTAVSGWDEVGSLNIEVFHKDEDWVFPSGAHAARTDVIPIELYCVDKLIYEDGDLVAECGMVFKGKDGPAVIVAAGIPPGSVSVSAPFSDEPFEPQFPLGDCRMEAFRTFAYAGFPPDPEAAP